MFEHFPWCLYCKICFKHFQLVVLQRCLLIVNFVSTFSFNVSMLSSLLFLNVSCFLFFCFFFLYQGALQCEYSFSYTHTSWICHSAHYCRCNWCRHWCACFAVCVLYLVVSLLLQALLYGRHWSRAQLSLHSPLCSGPRLDGSRGGVCRTIWRQERLHIFAHYHWFHGPLAHKLWTCNHHSHRRSCILQFSSRWFGSNQKHYFQLCPLCWNR